MKRARSGQGFLPGIWRGGGGGRNVTCWKMEREEDNFMKSISPTSFSATRATRLKSVPEIGLKIVPRMFFESDTCLNSSKGALFIHTTFAWVVRKNHFRGNFWDNFRQSPPRQTPQLAESDIGDFEFIELSSSRSIFCMFSSFLPSAPRSTSGGGGRA